MKTISKKIIPIFLSLVGILLITINCQPDELKNNGLAISSDALNADFTIDASNAASNRYIFNGNNENVLANIWDLGDGNSPINSGSNLSIFIPYAGNYTIQHTSVGRGGASKVTSQVLVVPTSDPLFGNLVKGGEFTTQQDIDKWTILKIAGTHVNWTFANGFATVKGSHPSAYGQQGIYQEINVKKDVKYKVDMKIKGSASANCWFEVHVGTAVPVQNSDYGTAALTQRLRITTFNGCQVMNSTFNGQLLALSCFNPTPSFMKFPQTGKVYLVIRAGGLDTNNTLGTNGVSITDVKFYPVL